MSHSILLPATSRPLSQGATMRRVRGYFQYSCGRCLSLAYARDSGSVLCRPAQVVEALRGPLCRGLYPRSPSLQADLKIPGDRSLARAKSVPSDPQTSHRSRMGPLGYAKLFHLIKAIQAGLELLGTFRPATLSDVWPVLAWPKPPTIRSTLQQ